MKVEVYTTGGKNKTHWTKYVARFPTKGAALGFYVGGHFMMHMGQLSAWRRAMGMGAA